MTDWQKIKSVPKDGSMVLLRDAEEIELAHFVDGFWREPGDDGDYYKQCQYWYNHATHWLPVPSWRVKS